MRTRRFLAGEAIPGLKPRLLRRTAVLLAMTALSFAPLCGTGASTQVLAMTAVFMRFFLNLSLLIFIFHTFAFAEESSSHNEVFQSAMQLRSEGQFQKSELEFKRALELEPNNPHFRYELANLYALEHDDALSTQDNVLADYYLQSAARELDQAVMIQPDYWSARFNLGVVYKKQGKYESARREFKKVLEQNPQALAALMQIGETYENQSFYDEAESVYEDARDKGVPNDQILEAMRNLEMGRAQSYRSQQSQMGQSLNSLSQKMRPDYLNNAGSNNSQGSSLAGIGSALMQQFSQGRNQQKNNQNNSQW